MKYLLKLHEEEKENDSLERNEQVAKNCKKILFMGTVFVMKVSCE